MLKAKKFNIAETNIALFGTDVEKKIREAAGEKEQAWAGVGKAVGIDIWRIEKFQVKRVTTPKGQFYAGDSYIVLYTYKKTPTDEKLMYNVHFWLGKDTSQDEAGAAAYKTVELDDLLKGAPVQYREVQDHESPLFLSYFDRFMTLDGGVDSGFNHVAPTVYRARLLHIKGTRKGRRGMRCVLELAQHAIFYTKPTPGMIVREVPKTYKSLNAGDVFILDGGVAIYQWNGSASSGVEKVKAAELAQSLESDRKGLAKTIVCDQGDKDCEPFWTALGDKGAVATAAAGGADSAATAPKKLFRLSDATATLTFTEVACGRVLRSQFDSKDVFVYDNGMEVFVWVGSKATAQEKAKGLQYAQDYLGKYGRPAWLPISKVVEGGESEVFVKSLDG